MKTIDYCPVCNVMVTTDDEYKSSKWYYYHAECFNAIIEYVALLAGGGRIRIEKGLVIDELKQFNKDIISIKKSIGIIDPEPFTFISEQKRIKQQIRLNDLINDNLTDEQGTVDI